MMCAVCKSFLIWFVIWFAKPQSNTKKRNIKREKRGVEVSVHWHDTNFPFGSRRCKCDLTSTNNNTNPPYLSLIAGKDKRLKIKSP